MEFEHPVTGEVLDRPLIGSMDAIVIDQGKAAVWELKTAKRKWTADQFEFDPQLTAYRIGARSLGLDEAELKVLVTTKTLKPDVQVERIVRHDRDEVELIEQVFSVVRAVEAGLDHRLRGWACRGCAYAGVCG